MIWQRKCNERRTIPEECQQMGLNARKVFEQKYTADKNYEMLMDIYQQAIKDSQESVVGSR